MGIYGILFYGGLILAIIFLIATIVIFFVMHIPEALGVVTGSTQKKAIEEIRSGGLGTQRTRGRKGLAGAIQTRDVDVTMAKNGTGTMKGSGSMKNTGPMKGSGSIPSDTFKREDKRSGDASQGLAEKAVRDAKEAIEKQAEREREALEQEETEILTYNDTKRDSSEDTTSILENEQETDVLTADDLYGGSGDEDADDIDKDEVSEDYDYDNEATDVLKTVSEPAEETEPEEEVTDVLRTQSIVAPGAENEYDEELDKTDVLAADVSGLDPNEIYGTYNPEMTAVLRSDMAPTEASVEKPKMGLEQPGITVIYNETIVHTDESL